MNSFAPNYSNPIINSQPLSQDELYQSQTFDRRLAMQTEFIRKEYDDRLIALSEVCRLINCN